MASTTRLSRGCRSFGSLTCSVFTASGKWKKDIRRELSAILDLVVNNKDAYIVVDGITLRPQNTSLNGVGQAFDVFWHAKKYSPKQYRATGL